MAVAVILAVIAGILIVAGIVVFVIGLFMIPSVQGVVGGQADTGLAGWLKAHLSQVFKILFDTTGKYKKYDKIMAGGLLLIFLGIAFLLAGGLTAIVSAATGGGDGGDTTTTTTTPGTTSASATT